MTIGSVHVLNGLNFDAVVMKAGVPVVVDFSATWCRPCKVQLAVLERIAAASAHIVVGTVDVEESPDLAARFAIRGMPTLVVFHEGRETARRLGLTTERDVRALAAAVPYARGSVHSENGPG